MTDEREAAAARQLFTTTRWSLVAQARPGGAKEALAELGLRYWYPVYAYVRRCGHGPAAAQELTRGFIAQLIERGAVAQPGARFRTWLLGALLEASLAGTVNRRNLPRYVLSSLLPWACFTTLFVWWAHRLPQSGPDPLTTAANFGKSMTHLLSIVYVAVVAVVACAALTVARARRDSGAPLTRSTRAPWRSRR